MASKHRSSGSGTDGILLALRAFGLGLPQAHTKSPWPGHLDLAVKDKTFAYLSIEGEPFSISCKLPRSNELALMIPGTSPTAYGLGKSGWVTATFADGDVPTDLLKDWILESYRAQAPKKVLALLEAALAADGKETTPAPQKATPTSKKATPTSKKATPTSKKATRTSKKATPTSKKATPTSKKATPTSKKATPKRAAEPKP
jgi:predicted DNA-binding protein (MmcQ/YjbR family)